MPEVSRFYGIVVRIFYDDHNPPHFHAEYGEHEVLVNINTLALLGGSLPAHRNFVHPKVPKPVTISGAAGDDAKHYQVRAVQLAIQESKK